MISGFGRTTAEMWVHTTWGSCQLMRSWQLKSPCSRRGHVDRAARSQLSGTADAYQVRSTMALH